MAAIAAAVTWSSWYLNSGFKDNETIKIIAEQLNANATARSVLGDKIEITSLTGSHYSTELSRGTDESYGAKVKGSKAEGTISIKVKTPPGGTRHIDELILTGPDGHTYNLLQAASAPPTPLPTTPPSNTGGGSDSTPPDSGAGTGAADGPGSSEGRRGGSNEGGDTGDDGGGDSGQSHAEGRSR